MIHCSLCGTQITKHYKYQTHHSLSGPQRHSHYRCTQCEVHITRIDFLEGNKFYDNGPIIVTQKPLPIDWTRTHMETENAPLPD